MLEARAVEGHCLLALSLCCVCVYIVKHHMLVGATDHWPLIKSVSRCRAPQKTLSYVELTARLSDFVLFCA